MKITDAAEMLMRKGTETVEDKEEVRCPACETIVWKNDVEAALDVAESHDEQRHDGERTTKVNGFLPPQFSDEEAAQIREAVQMLKEAEADG